MKNEIYVDTDIKKTMRMYKNHLHLTYLRLKSQKTQWGTLACSVS